MMRVALIIGLVAFLISGCGLSGINTENYENCIESGMEMIPWAAEMENVFANCDHFIVHYGIGNELEKEWQSEAYFGDRFAISMSVQVKLNRKRSKILAVSGEPRFFIREYTEVVPTGTGGYSAKIGKQFRFGVEKWGQFLQTKSIGIFDPDWMRAKNVEFFNDLAEQVRHQRQPFTRSVASEKIKREK